MSDTREVGKIKIVGHDVTIVVRAPGMGQEAFGQWNRHALQISISSHIHPQDYVATLLHEIIHAIDNFMGTGLEEDQVSTISQCLYQVLRDNVQLLQEPKEE